MIGRWFQRLLICIALVAEPAFAQASADLALTAEVVPSGPIRPGAVVEIVLTFRNLGPADAVGAGAVSSDYPFLAGGLFDLFELPQSACTVDYDDFVGPPGEPSYLIAIVLAGSIPAGETRTCTLGLFVYPESRGTYELTFRADSGTPDDDTTNDLSTLALVFADRARRAVPTTTASFLAVLSVLLVAIALVLGQPHFAGAVSAKTRWCRVLAKS